MRFALLATASTLLVGIATFACSGTASQGSTEEADSGTSVDNQTSTTPVTTATGVSTVVTLTDAGVLDAAVVATTDGDAGAACGATSVRETESNDTVANTVPATTGSFCGRLAGNDVDMVSFTMPQQVGRFSARFDQLLAIGNRSNIQVTADVNGTQFNFFGTWPFLAGGVYTFKLEGVFSDTTSEIDYDLAFNFQ